MATATTLNLKPAPTQTVIEVSSSMCTGSSPVSVTRKKTVKWFHCMLQITQMCQISVEFHAILNMRPNESAKILKTVKGGGGCTKKTQKKQDESQRHRHVTRKSSHVCIFSRKCREHFGRLTWWYIRNGISHWFHILFLFMFVLNRWTWVLW